ncbi:MAG: DUF4209 domain-containing protein, partial [Acholeplasma sp.]|nr:DUF4209 domain-containing protein [Acholeplasma sp.]
NRLKEPIFSDDTIDVITFVYQNAPFSQELAVAMINHLVISTNKMCENMRIKNIDVISCISSLDDLIEHLRKIKSLNFGVNNKKFGTKMHECILSLFYYKRQLLRDEEYTRRNFKEIPFNITIPKSEKSYREYIEENIMSLYNLVRIDFDKILEGAIKSYSEHPLVYLVTDLNIDSVNGIYSISEEYSSNVFSDYYEKRGIELSKELENNLRNIVGQKYYKTMMKYHSLSFNSSLAIISEVLKEDFIWIKNKFRDLLEFTSPVYDNDYVLLCKNVISIEYYLYKIAEKKSLGQKEDPEKILAELFKQYEGNSEYRNGFQFINFILFDFFGPNLRNKLLHGMELNKSNLSSQSYQIFACVIFLNYFMSLEKLQ